MMQTSISRRLVLGAGVILGATASRPERAAANAIQTRYSNGPGAVADSFFFPSFRQSFIKTSGAVINTLVGGKGPPLLLIHGHPLTHVSWHKVAQPLAQEFTVVMTDMRGYGDSSKPEGGADHVNYSKRAMGLDQVEVMKALGFERFQVVRHDRGGRVLQRMMLDHPDVITRGAVLDIAPTDQMYSHTNQEFATKYFWWFFHIQDAPLPETMINAEPEVYIKAHLDAQSRTEGAVTAEAFAEYLRCYRDPACVHGVCEDYRASVTIDMQNLRADNGRKVPQPLLALWGAKGTVGQLFDVLSLWRLEAAEVQGEPLPCGHLIPEEAPDALLKSLKPFLVSS
jgi:haloacetate dehalogenase